MEKRFEATALIFLSVSAYLKLLEILDDELTDEDTAVDYFPETKDNTFFKKLGFYFSQMTLQTQFLSIIYFGMKLFTDKNLDFWFFTLAPACIAVNIQYFSLIVPGFGSDFDIHELKYIQLIPHGMDTVFFLFTLVNMKNLQTKYLLNHFIYVAFAFVVVLLNKMYRNVWSYDLFDLTKAKGWINFTQTTVITQICSCMLFGFHKVFIEPSPFVKSIRTRLFT